MNRNIVKIADLFNFSNAELGNVSIKVSVSIRSIRHGTNRHSHFYMDLRDDSGDITAVAYSDNEPCDNQLHLIQDNRTYIITNFSLENSNERYTSICKEKEIVLNNNTVVKLCGNAPKYEWPLTPLDKAGKPYTKEFFNIVGLCTNVTETEIVLGELTRQVTLVDEARSEVVLKVWNQETYLFDELDLNLHPVFFVKDARVYKYRGRSTSSLTTSRYLQLLDPDDPRAADVRKGILKDYPTKDENTGWTVAKYEPNHGSGHPNPTKTNRRHVKIADLSDDFENANDTIIATVTMKSIRHKLDKETYFLIDLRDESGEIFAAVMDDACAKYQHLIQKNRTYSISGLSLENPNGEGSSITHKFMLYLYDDCEIKLLGNALPKVEWPMSPLAVVYGRDKMEFFHIFGLCTDVGKTVNDKRRVTLVDQLRRQVFLEVGFEDAAVIDALDLNTHPVLFAKDTRMSDTNESETVLIQTAYLELLEPDDPRARRVIEALGFAVSTNVGNTESETSSEMGKRSKKKSK